MKIIQNFSYKEVNTCTLLHSKTAAAYSKPIVIVCNNIDAFVLTVAFADETEVSMYHRRETQSGTRYVNFNVESFLK